MTHATVALVWFTRTHVMWAMGLLGGVTLLLVFFCLLRWRWGQAKALAKNPLAKYIVLSVVAHLILAIAAYFAHVLEPHDSGLGGPAVIVELGDAGGTNLTTQTQPWDPPTTPAASADQPRLLPPEFEVPVAERPEVDREPDPPVDSLTQLDSVVPDTPMPDATPADEPLQQPAMAAKFPEPPSRFEESGGPTSEAQDPSGPIDEPIVASSPAQNNEPESPADQPTELAQVPNTDAQADALSSPEDNTQKSVADAEHPSRQGKTSDPRPLPPTLSQPVPTNSRPLKPVVSQWGKPEEKRSQVTTPPAPKRDDGSPLASIYRDRWVKDRLQLARARGGSRETEAAVQQSLKWLAAAQNRDGRWDASRFGSGQPPQAGGQNRRQAGREADSGITGLAVLCFLGAGHTHRDGLYQDTVQTGLDFLLRTQQSRPDGSLVGSASGFAAMYCHGIATLALSEAYALTGDTALQVPLRRAIAFTLAAQHPVTGGWRYLPRQPGDTSQLGWQLMALTSARYAGEAVPSSTWSGAGRFLNSVSWGNFGGLASYRPGERPSTPMTAEALLCRLFLQTPTDHPLVREAADHLVRDLPGQGRVNFYYWYYGTLALYHLQDNHWDVWNRSVKRQLVTRQRTDGSLAGSWDTNSVWGASGGRVYTTALATLTLEVYYRYRPLAEPVPEHTAWRTR